MPVYAIKDTLRFNITFWLAYFVYEWIANASVFNEYYRYLINATVLVPLTMLAALFTVHVCFKQCYLKNKRTMFWVLLCSSIILFGLARRAFNYFYTYPLYFPEGHQYPFLFLPKLIIEGVTIYLVVGLYAMYYLARAWYEQQSITRELRQKQTEAELEFLKAQIKPHFIFNTLNNIYSHAIHKNENVPDLIHRLSSFLSYNLYNTKSEFVDFSQELEYVNSYIALEKIRYEDRLDVSVNIYNSPEGFKICPLLLLPLVENSFKHGFVSTISACWLRIDITLENNWFTLKIENSVGEKNTLNTDGEKGLGIENVRRRLAIIYPDQHEFKTIVEKDSFITILKIKDTQR
jgi:two-component system, LytTR family, sensor kinase